MKIVILVAVDQKLAIGYRGRLPWQGHQKQDMRRFVNLTTKPVGYPLIMGRKTYESFPKRPLPGRTNIVLTRNPRFKADGCVIASSIQEALAIAKLEKKDKTFVIGGTEVYVQALPLANEICLTRIHHQFEADAYFPEIDPREWRETEDEHHYADETNWYPYTFQKFVRVRPS